MDCHPNVQGSSESPSVNSLDGSEIDLSVRLFLGRSSPPPPVYLPSLGVFVMCFLCFVKPL